ncbi:hypothetical protein KA078_01835 [Candidatus Woesebacteria bacterium]|nr:hypothetical protein [Candidatus Woesebacteria bacterium]
MNQTQLLQSPARQTQPGGVNPFARALAEAERANYSQQGASDSVTSNSEAASQPTDGMYPDLEKQQTESARLHRLEQMRRRLHAEIHPTEMQQVFDARQRQVEERILAVREELKALNRGVAVIAQEIQATLMTRIVEPGQTGSYFINYFTHLRGRIILLKQSIKSASTCLNIVRDKAQKRGKQPGLVVAGQDHEQTTTIQDMMHHERSNNYAGS